MRIRICNVVAYVLLLHLLRNLFLKDYLMFVVSGFLSLKVKMVKLRRAQSVELSRGASLHFYLKSPLFS